MILVLICSILLPHILCMDQYLGIRLPWVKTILGVWLETLPAQIHMCGIKISCFLFAMLLSLFLQICVCCPAIFQGLYSSFVMLYQDDRLFLLSRVHIISQGNLHSLKYFAVMINNFVIFFIIFSYFSFFPTHHYSFFYNTPFTAVLEYEQSDLPGDGPFPRHGLTDGNFSLVDWMNPFLKAHWASLTPSTLCTHDEIFPSPDTWQQFPVLRHSQHFLLQGITITHPLGKLFYDMSMYLRLEL